MGLFISNVGRPLVDGAAAEPPLDLEKRCQPDPSFGLLLRGAWAALAGALFRNSG
jgi:hypothetical protein